MPLSTCNVTGPAPSFYISLRHIYWNHYPTTSSHIIFLIIHIFYNAYPIVLSMVFYSDLNVIIGIALYPCNILQVENNGCWRGIPFRPWRKSLVPLCLCWWLFLLSSSVNIRFHDSSRCSIFWNRLRLLKDWSPLPSFWSRWLLDLLLLVSVGSLLLLLPLSSTWLPWLSPSSPLYTWCQWW